MNRIALLAAGCAVLALAACDHPDAKRQKAEHALKVVSKLDCPDKQGSLTRVSAAADGLSCVYSADGAEVTLKLVKLTNGDAGAALAPIEADLRTLMPGVKTPSGDPQPTPGGESVDIKLPGVTIKANDNGAKIEAGGAQINADDDGAEVRVSRNVEVDGKRVESEVHRRRRGGDDAVMAKFILASDKAAGEWGVVGYSARGPKGGPLVVGTVKAKEDPTRDNERDTLFEDVEKLIRHNVGGRGGHAMIIR